MNKFITKTFKCWCKNSHHWQFQIRETVMVLTEVFALSSPKYIHGYLTIHLFRKHSPSFYSSLYIPVIENTQKLFDC